MTNSNSPLWPARGRGALEHESVQLVTDILNAASDQVIGLARVNDLAGETYWKRKDLPLAVGMLSQGIVRGRAWAETAAKSDRELAEKILSNVKAMAFNLASFTWPGWNEPGISITDEELKAGREAARLNLELAVELNRPLEKIGLAHWLVGAHELSAEEYSTALDSFTSYQQLATTKEHQLVAEGYIAIATLLGGNSVDETFDQSVRGLKQLATEDANFFAEQLVMVREYFERHGAKP